MDTTAGPTTTAGAALVAVEPAEQTNQQQTVSSDPKLTNAVLEAWEAHCAKLGEDERKKFESFASQGLEEYLQKLEEACQNHRNESRLFKFIDWFEPLFKAVELWTPAAIVAIQAYPNPGSLILGGIIGALQATSRFRDYQRLTVQLLARMGRKAHILEQYETVVYKSDIRIQKALVDVYGDVIEFCLAAVRYAKKDGKLIAKVKGLALTPFRDFEAHLGPFAEAFETHIEHLESLGRLCDKKRLKDLHDNLNARYRASEQATADNEEHFQRLGAAMDQLLQRKREIQLQEEQLRKENYRVTLLDWLSTLSFRAAYDERCEDHLEGTGFWLLNSEAYRSWKSSDEPDLLWVRGKPGSGKSVLAAVTITDLKLDVEPETALGYAFCQRANESFQHPTKIFAALAKQVGKHKSTIEPVLEMEYKASHSTSNPSHRAVRLVMASAVKQFKRVFLVVDALDECKDNDQLAQDLRDLVENKGLPPVKVIVFSRHEYNLQECFRSYKQIEPDLGANEEDLKAYIYSLFPDDPKKENLNAQIRNECIAKADGMFLWVKLLAQNLNKKPFRSKEKLKRIKDIPPGLDDIYDRILEDICSQDEELRSTAFLVLLWIMHASRPLSRIEMIYAVADYSGATKQKDVSKHDSPEHLVAICASLVFIDKDGAFRLCHESVRTHLQKRMPAPTQPLSDFYQQLPKAHQLLAETCLNYILLDDFNRGVALSSAGLDNLANRKPFFWYASSWDLHVTKENESLLRCSIMKCANSQRHRELCMQGMLSRHLDDFANTAKLWKYGGTSNPLHLLAICGLKQTAESNPDMILLALEADGSGKTPLAYAMECQHHDMTLWLLDQIQNTPGRSLDMMQKLSAIHYAAEHGWADILEIILVKNKDLVNLKIRPNGETPLTLACMSGKMDAAETLIRHKANVNLKGGTGDNPLLLASYYGHANIVDLLLAHGADPNCYDARGFGALYYASDIGNAEIVAALLGKNADPFAAGPDGKNKSPVFVAASRNATDVLEVFYNANSRLLVDLKAEQGMNAIHGAAWFNSAKTLEYLLKVGNQKDSVTEDERRETALHIAASNGSLESVKVLVKAGCDPDIPDAEGRNALHAGASSSNLRIVRYILKKQPGDTRGSLLNRRSQNGETPLHSAVLGANPEIVSCLLDAGCDITTISTPLHWAAQRGLTKIASVLLQRTKDPNPRNEDDETPLHVAAKAAKFDFIVQFFQDCAEMGLSIDVNAKGKSNTTALGLALGNDCEYAAKFLLEKGAISVCNGDGNFPIHHASWRGYDSVVEQLLGHEGARKRGYFGRTPLSCAALRGHLGTVKLLLTVSADILNEMDELGGTPVCRALCYGHVEVAHCLLDAGADHTVVNEHGRSLLMIAVGLRDLPMVQRLLALGCRGDKSDIFGATAFGAAVETGSTEIVDALIAAGFNGIGLTDSYGNSCSLFAAQAGDLKMLHKLDAHGARHSAHNLWRRNAAHAAETAHPDILEFLNDRGVDLCLPDCEGFTPLMFAANEGNAAAVSYLLQSQAHAVNQCTFFGQETALTLAAQSGFPQTIRLLLAAGADPHHRNVFGSSSLEYASYHRPSLREMHKAKYFRSSGSFTSRKQTLFRVISQRCKQILQLPQEPSLTQLYYRLTRVRELCSALFLVEDYETAKTPLIEIFWPPEPSLVEVTFTCTVCRAEKYQGDKYICQTCPYSNSMCKMCHDDFKAAGNQIPDPLKEVMELENQVLPVRLRLLDEASIDIVHASMRFFVAGCEWAETTLEKYEIWEQKYNSSNRFQALARPGQELLKLVADVTQFSKEAADASDATGTAKAALKLAERYAKYRRRYGFIQDPRGFVCENHNFMVLKEEEARHAKVAGDNLDSGGRMKTAFLLGLIDKYSDCSPGLQEPSGCTSDPHLAALSQRSSEEVASKVHTTAGQPKGEDSPPASIPRRSFTVAFQEPVKGLGDFKPVFMHTGTDATPSAPALLADESIRPVKRAQTFPVRLATDSRPSFSNSGDVLPQLLDPSKDDSMRAIADCLLNTVSSSPLVGPSVWSDALGQEVVVSREPEEAHRVSTTAGTASIPDITAANKADNMSKIIGLYVRLLLLTASETGGGVVERPETATLGRAIVLHVTEAMTPGFVDRYFAIRQDELNRSVDNGDSDSGHDGRTAAAGGDHSDSSEDE